MHSDNNYTNTGRESVTNIVQVEGGPRAYRWNIRGGPVMSR